MDTVVVMYLTYVGLSVALTIWVAQTLSRAGVVFLQDVFEGNERLADAVNHLLVVGFYLVNLGYVSLALRSEEIVTNPQQAIEALSWKIGLVLLVLGGMHFMNMFVFSRIRKRSNQAKGRGPRGAAPLDRGPPPPLPLDPTPPTTRASTYVRSAFGAGEAG